MYILGVSAFYHDSAACLIQDGRILAAAQEERFTRKKHDPSFPLNAIQYCLAEAGVDASQIANVVFYEKPFLKFERLLETYLAFAPRGFASFRKAMPLWIKEKLFQKPMLSARLKEALGDNIEWRDRLLFSEHHLSHAASAFYPSPFNRAAILTLDGVGEWATTSVAIGNGNALTIQRELHFPHSLGLLYSAFTHYVGFKVNSGEYKLMGLAPYGKPAYLDLIKEHLVSLADDGSFHLDMAYFDYAVGLTMTNNKFHDLFGGPPRTPESELTQRDMDIAASVQKVTEQVILGLARGVARETGEKNLCLAGGVALNCVANGVLQREKVFEKIWIQPAAGDAGGSAGAALAVWHLHYGKKRSLSSQRDGMNGALLGPEFSNAEVEKTLKRMGAVFYQFSESDLIERVAVALEAGKAVGWMQGRMEFGPRALGNRSILADPRSPKMQRQLNIKVKNREGFRPFAPSVLGEDVDGWFKLEGDSPYMLIVAEVLESRRKEISDEEALLDGLEKLHVQRSSVPAITHVDYSARVQTVHSDTNPRFHSLISKFKEKTGCPLIVNTSFNVRGEPIVCTPEDAYRCFMSTELDVLVIGDFLLTKDDQLLGARVDFGAQYDPD